MTDIGRRAYDPYAPTPRTESAKSPEPVGAPESHGAPTSLPDAVRDNLAPDPQPEQRAEGDSGDELDGMRRVDLLKVAEEEGVAAYGNRESLIERIRKARAARLG